MDRRRTGRALAGLGVLCLAVLMASMGPATAVAAHPAGSSSGAAQTSPLLALPRPSEAPGGSAPEPGLSPANPGTSFRAATSTPDAGCDDCAYYMQEGAFLDQACFANVTGSCTAYSGYSSLYVDVQVETSPYITGFELNGMTNTGDWYQSMVGYNWCADGFEVMNEVWNDAQDSISGPCVTSSLTVSAGDEVQLGLYVAGSGDICFTAKDLTHTQAEFQNCVTQPDGGATPTANYFAYGADDEGYFTGPMTEIVDPSATTCEAYTSMPTVSYQFVSGAYVVKFTPWSDEWYPPTDALCYNSIASTDFSMAPGNTAAQYFDASGGSTYGPHWQAAQNISSLSMLGWWEFTTDATLPMPTATPSSAGLQQAVSIQFEDPVVIEHLDTKATYADWSESLPGSWTCAASDSNEIYTCSGSATATGSYPVQLVIGETGGHSLASPVLEYVISSAPAIASASAAPSSIDVGQTVVLSVVTEDGTGTWSYVWNNLPAGCTTSSTDSLSCTPTSPGNYSVTVTATDSTDASVTSSPIAFSVYPDPSVTVPVGSPGARGTDVETSVTFAVSASGGAGDYVYVWNGLPTGCTGSDGTSVTCAPADVGSFGVSVSVTDANHFSVTGPVLEYTVYARPTLISFLAAPTTVLASDSATLRTVVTGGAPPLSYDYAGLPTGCTTGDNANLSCTPTAAGSYRISVTVTDASGVAVQGNLTLVVKPSVLGLAPTEGYVLLGGVLAAILLGVLAAALVGRRRRRQPPR